MTSKPENVANEGPWGGLAQPWGVRALFVAKAVGSVASLKGRLGGVCGGDRSHFTPA